MIFLGLILALLFCGPSLRPSSSISLHKPPHIIYILADDLGWNDVGFHGSNQIPTPNIDALAFSGVILNQFYVNHVCSPSRGALMTGLQPIHIGLQNCLIGHMTPFGLPLQFRTLPEYLGSSLGYVSRLVGKWHLGSFRQAYTPTFRGFQSHLGIWNGMTNYFSKRMTCRPNISMGFDFRDGMRVAWEYDGDYATDTFTAESLKIIEDHDQSDPLFLLVSHMAPHGPVQAPNLLLKRFHHLKTKDFPYRHELAAGVYALDQSVGKIVKKLKEKNMLENSIIIFSTDNGGASEGYDFSDGSNFPLRGMKGNLFEGGVRGVAAIWSPLISKPKRVSRDLIAIQDLLPTLLSAASGHDLSIPKIDGMNVWQTISKGDPSPRTTVFHGSPTSRLFVAVRHKDWKLNYGSPFSGARYTEWFGDSGRNDSKEYNLNAILSSPTAQALKSIGYGPPSKKKILRLRKKSEVLCPLTNDIKKCDALNEYCLFNIVRDPCERNNLAEEFPQILNDLRKIALAFQDSAIKGVNTPYDNDADPKYWNYTWTNWRDHLRPQTLKRVYEIDRAKTRIPTIFDADIQAQFTTSLSSSK
ncbi:hypothetical protein TCAL_06738 [Tigriopus californicus]|uniref:Sulfatase N-terminal domain-containing protein n=1 Tax=Tigriopus californicus TaxID=6832 RepID=A0A553PMI0_TIGCA|nr:arylsulfatase B-like [Tigriopus californicus]TRY78891.1 hypothetical protein TCAL_06738 [Tigriopus californicus]